MTAGRALLLTLLLVLLIAGTHPAGAAPDPGGEDMPMVCGVWTYYAAGVAERVQAYRGLTCPDCVGLAIAVDRTQLGRRIDIRHAGEWVGPFLVVDVGTGHHRPHLVGEVDYPTAMAWRITRPWWTCYRDVGES